MVNAIPVFRMVTTNFLGYTQRVGFSAVVDGVAESASLCSFILSQFCHIESIARAS